MQEAARVAANSLAGTESLAPPPPTLWTPAPVPPIISAHDAALAKAVDVDWGRAGMPPPPPGAERVPALKAPPPPLPKRSTTPRKDDPHSIRHEATGGAQASVDRDPSEAAGGTGCALM